MILACENESMWKLLKTRNTYGSRMKRICPKPGRAIARERASKKEVQCSIRRLLIAGLFGPYLHFLKINQDRIGLTGMFLSMIFTQWMRQ
jgi:hypothetical protein